MIVRNDAVMSISCPWLRSAECRRHAVRRVLAAMDARVDLQPRWRGGEIDRLLDARQAALVTAVAVILTRMG